MVAEPLIAWLLDSDPTLRWQVERDLVREPPEVWEATRAQIATEGFGARLLALQDPDGQWAAGSFFPADFDFHGSEATQGGQPWTATTWTLNSLREWGLDPGVLRERRTAELLAENSRWDYNNLPFWSGEVDCCINAWTVANGVWLGADITGIVDSFLEHRLPDGGWNCEWVEGSTRSSFHSTLNSLKGLLAYDAGTGGTHATRAARHSGQEYLLRRGLFRRLSTAEPVAPWVDQFVYPFRWTYNVLQRSGVLPPGFAARRGGAGPAHDGRNRAHPRRQTARRHLAPGRPSPRTRVVRGRCTGRRTIEVADFVRDPRTRLVGKRARLVRQWPSQMRFGHAPMSAGGRLWITSAPSRRNLPS